MASPLESQIKNAIYKGFKGKLLTGTFRRGTPTGAVDSKGDATFTYETESVDGIVAEYSAFQKATAGIPESDVQLVITAGSLSLKPRKDDQVLFRTTWYQVRAVNVDSAGAAWVLQAFAIEDPTA